MAFEVELITGGNGIFSGPAVSSSAIYFLTRALWLLDPLPAGENGLVLPISSTDFSFSISCLLEFVVDLIGDDVL